MDQTFIDRARQIAQSGLDPDGGLTSNVLLVEKLADSLVAAELAKLPGDVADPLAALRSIGLEATADALSRLIAPDPGREPAQP